MFHYVTLRFLLIILVFSNCLLNTVGSILVYVYLGICAKVPLGQWFLSLYPIFIDIFYNLSALK